MSWKQWDQGEIVEAGDFQEFIQDQVVQSYANASERNTTLGTAVSEGMISYREDANVIEVYDGANWVGISAAGDITGVTAGTALTGGGVTGDLTLDVDLTAITIPASQLSDVTATAAELNILDGVTATSAELNILDGVTADATELNLLDGVTATTAEINYLDGVSSGIQSQLDGKVDESDGSVTQATESSAVVRNITLSTSAPTGGSDGDVWLVYTP